MKGNGKISGLRIIGLVMPFVVSIPLLAGCKTTKSIDATMIEWSSRDSSIVETQSSIDLSWYQKLLTDTSWWSKIGHIIIYDTSAPKDSLGKHPVQAEIDYTEEHHNNVSQRTDSGHVVYDTIRREVIVKDSTFEKSVYKEVTVKKTPWYFKVQVLLALLLLSFGLGGYTAWKLKK